jgi:hypothetical protein
MRAAKRRVDPSDLVGIAEISVRTGVTNAAVANWADRIASFPGPVCVLACGPIWVWPAVADWLTELDMPNPSYAWRSAVLTPEQAKSAVALARHAPTRLVPDIAKGYRVSARYLQLLVQADLMGEEFGWFTKQRRDKHALTTAELVSRCSPTTPEVPVSDFDDPRDDERAADPTDDYLEEEAESRRLWHMQQAHEGIECDCPPAPVVFSSQAPF